MIKEYKIGYIYQKINSMLKHLFFKQGYFNISFNNKIRYLFLVLFISIFFTYNIKAYETEEIKLYDITLEVKESGIIHVNQKIKYSFSDERHGIYANIPQSYSMSINEEKKNYFFPVTNIKVKDYPFEVMKDLEGITIKIGDEKKYVSGVVDYEYSYDVETRDLGLNNQQMLYFNLVGNQWEIPINQVNFKIEMPKTFKQKPMFYTPDENDVDYKVTSKSITGQYKNKIDYGQALTIKLDLDNNYFIFEKNNNTQLAILIVGILMIVGLIILFLKYGKDDMVVKTIEFKAPDNMSSAQVGYVVDGCLQRKDITSLFIYWASKKYLSINQVEKNIFEFRKERNIPLRELDIERNIFNSLFSEKKVIKTNALPKEYFDAIIQAKKDYNDYYKQDKDYVAIESKIMMWFKLVFFSSLLLFSLFFTISDNFEFGYLLIFSILFGILLIVMKVRINYKNYQKEENVIFNKKSENVRLLTTGLVYIFISFNIAFNTFIYYKFFFAFILAFSVGMALNWIIGSKLYLIINDWPAISVKNKVKNSLTMTFLIVSYTFIYLKWMEFIDSDFLITTIILILGYIGIILTSFMSKRTRIGNRWLGQILGLKNFIKYAEKDRLEMLVNENPSYFYDILPYAYVLNVSDKWINKFENIHIDQPYWYSSSASINYSLHSISNSVNAIPNAQGGIGGFSGEGKTGFSGGGFGGGGGGSW